MTACWTGAPGAPGALALSMGRDRDWREASARAGYIQTGAYWRGAGALESPWRNPGATRAARCTCTLQYPAALAGRAFGWPWTHARSARPLTARIT